MLQNAGQTELQLCGESSRSPGITRSGGRYSHTLQCRSETLLYSCVFVKLCHKMVEDLYQTGVEAVHIASILGDRGTILAFNVEQRLLPLLNEKIITLGVNSNSPPNSFSVIPHTSAWDGQSEAFIMIAELHGDRFV